MVDSRNIRRGTSGASTANCKALMCKLRTLDFAIIETALYLDAYPGCRGALNYYSRLIRERAKVAEMINSTCGPLTMKENMSTTEWNWHKGPWPWEPDAN